MNSDLVEVLETTRALPRQERSEVAQALIASLEAVNDCDEARYAELHAAVDEGSASLDEGRSTRVPIEDLRDYLRELGSQATDRHSASN